MQYNVRLIPCATAKEYIIANHYSHGCQRSPSPCYGLFEANLLIGVLMFGTPCSESVRCSIYGDYYNYAVIELHRLHILDVTPCNTESWFIAKCLKLIRKDRPYIRAVVSFSDLTEKHHGTIYRAANAYFYGMAKEQTFYIDTDGRLRHPRQCGVNVDGIAMGWQKVRRQGKYRYLWVLCDKKERKQWLNRLKVKLEPYPAKIEKLL